MYKTGSPEARQAIEMGSTSNFMTTVVQDGQRNGNRKEASFGMRSAA